VYEYVYEYGSRSGVYGIPPYSYTQIALLLSLYNFTPPLTRHLEGGRAGGISRACGKSENGRSAGIANGSSAIASLRGGQGVGPQELRSDVALAMPPSER
jgi:hypothetical protein